VRSCVKQQCPPGRLITAVADDRTTRFRYERTFGPATSTSAMPSIAGLWAAMSVVGPTMSASPTKADIVVILGDVRK